MLVPILGSEAERVKVRGRETDYSLGLDPATVEELKPLQMNDLRTEESRTPLTINNALGLALQKTTWTATL